MAASGGVEPVADVRRLERAPHHVRDRDPSDELAAQDDGEGQGRAELGGGEEGGDDLRLPLGAHVVVGALGGADEEGLAVARLELGEPRGVLGAQEPDGRRGRDGTGGRGDGGHAGSLAPGAAARASH